MEASHSQFVGASCGSHGPYTFYKAFKFVHNNEISILSLGDFFFIKISDNVPVCIGEVQLLWEEKTTNQLLASVRLYFKPRDLPVLWGGQEKADEQNIDISCFGEDELLAMSEKLVVSIDDLVTRISSPEVTYWDYGMILKYVAGVSDSFKVNVDVNSDMCLAFAGSDDVPIRFDDVEKGKKEYAIDDRMVVAPVAILTFPAYCRYRAVLRRTENCPDSWMTNVLVKAIGGITSTKQRQRVMFCREVFDYPDLEELDIHKGQFAPNLKGRPRKRKSMKGDLDSDEYGSDERSSSSASVASVSIECHMVESEEVGPPNGVQHVVPVRVSKAEKLFLRKLKQFMLKQNSPIDRLPVLGCKQIDLFAFHKIAKEFGGYQKICDNRLWKSLYDRLGGQASNTSAATTTRRHYERLILPYESHIRHRRLQKQCVRLGEVQPSSIATTDSEGVTPLLNGVDDNSPHSEAQIVDGKEVMQMTVANEERLPSGDGAELNCADANRLSSCFAGPCCMALGCERLNGHSEVAMDHGACFEEQVCPASSQQDSDCIEHWSDSGTATIVGDVDTVTLRRDCVSLADPVSVDTTSLVLQAKCQDNDSGSGSVCLQAEIDHANEQATISFCEDSVKLQTLRRESSSTLGHLPINVPMFSPPTISHHSSADRASPSAPAESLTLPCDSLQEASSAYSGQILPSALFTSTPFLPCPDIYRRYVQNGFDQSPSSHSSSPFPVLSSGASSLMTLNIPSPSSFLSRVRSVLSVDARADARFLFHTDVISACSDPHVLASAPVIQCLRPPFPAHSTPCIHHKPPDSVPLHEQRLRRLRLHTWETSGLPNGRFPHPEQVLMHIHSQQRLLKSRRSDQARRAKQMSAASRREKAPKSAASTGSTASLCSTPLGLPSPSDTTVNAVVAMSATGGGRGKVRLNDSGNSIARCVGNSRSAPDSFGAFENYGVGLASTGQSMVADCVRAQQTEVLHSALFGSQFTALPRAVKPVDGIAMPTYVPTMFPPHPAFVQAFLNHAHSSLPSVISPLSLYPAAVAAAAQLNSAHLFVPTDDLHQRALSMSAAVLPQYMLPTLTPASFISPLMSSVPLTSSLTIDPDTPSADSPLYM